MRRRLENEIINTLIPYRDKLPFEEIKAQIIIVLNDYDVQARSTELMIRDEDKNKKYIAMFLASKAAGGRTDKTLCAYKNYLVKIFNSIEKKCR